MSGWCPIAVSVPEHLFELVHTEDGLPIFALVISFAIFGPDRGG
jgi:hypothetical protein